MKYICNSFSLQMINDFPCTIRVQEVSSLPAEGEDCVSYVGHADTAKILGVSCCRLNITLSRGVELYVAQLQGGRLPEGATKLPEGFSFKFLKVTVE